MYSKVRAWAKGILLVSALAMGAALIAEHPCTRVAALVEMHSAVPIDTSGGTPGEDVGGDVAFAELEDSDDESSHRPLGLVIMNPDTKGAHKTRHADVHEQLSLEPPEPPPRA